ncbi:MAG: tryptophan synthase subunit alpha [Methanomassiliicoccales archaeon]
MSQIRSVFERESNKGRGTLICYLTAGYPDKNSFLRYFQACVEGGADIMEVGIPFSDPVADGPVIQSTSEKALKGGVTPWSAMEMAADAKMLYGSPTILMGYYNPIFRMGEKRFVRLAREYDIDGIIVADLPYEESNTLREECEESGIDLIQMIAPTTNYSRMKAIASVSQGMVYLVAALGTTGVRDHLSHDLGNLIKCAKSACKQIPVGVGFGVCDENQVRKIISYGADGVIIGSALLSKISKGEGESVQRFISCLKNSCIKSY